MTAFCHITRYRDDPTPSGAFGLGRSQWRLPSYGWRAGINGDTRLEDGLSKRLWRDLGGLMNLWRRKDALDANERGFLRTLVQAKPTWLLLDFLTFHDAPL